jgi:hypothetical protein
VALCLFVESIGPQGRAGLLIIFQITTWNSANLFPKLHKYLAGIHQEGYTRSDTVGGIHQEGYMRRDRPEGIQQEGYTRRYIS